MTLYDENRYRDEIDEIGGCRLILSFNVNVHAH